MNPPARAEPAGRRLIVGITGATGTIYGVRLLQALQRSDVETHLVLSRWGARTLVHETPHTVEEVRRMATRAYSDGDQGAAPSSGSFLTMGMVIAPCSMRTLSAIAHGEAESLIHRAADVVLKERRRLVLLVREAPLSDIHLENMLKLSRTGVVISPPVPAFYDHPQTIDDLVNHTVQRVLDLFDVHLDLAERWEGSMAAGGAAGRGRQMSASLRAVGRRSRRKRR
ncbi:MAG: phenolic acid decarboxylase subunit B [Acidobacteria bacterium]|nr:MAG: phenolic acid decarboxylase subunit B [Acidobacteriota bacterium]PYQ26083.1 MAG: phenolic acid decarboxylase subunit B [Acidobacteriota bacterium]